MTFEAKQAAGPVILDRATEHPITGVVEGDGNRQSGAGPNLRTVKPKDNGRPQVGETKGGRRHSGRWRRRLRGGLMAMIRVRFAMSHVRSGIAGTDFGVQARVDPPCTRGLL